MKRLDGKKLLLCAILIITLFEAILLFRGGINSHSSAFRFLGNNLVVALLLAVFIKKEVSINMLSYVLVISSLITGLIYHMSYPGMLKGNYGISDIHTTSLMVADNVIGIAMICSLFLDLFRYLRKSRHEGESG